MIIRFSLHPPIPMRHFLLCALAALTCRLSAAPAAPAEIVSVKKIWDRGAHNAFTDLLRWHGRWWCVFREAEAHVGGDGAIRVLESADGETWTSAAALAEKDIDLRDPKLSVTPDDRLMLVCGGSVYRGTRTLQGRQPRVLFSSDGRAWTPPERVLAEGDWLWRVTWHGGVAYGTSYVSGGDEWTLRLVASRDGLTWETVAPLAVAGRPNETTLRFFPNGDMIAMVRREAGDRMGTFGVASPPYRTWEWRPSNHRFGGPEIIAAPGGGWIVCTRDHTLTKPGSTAGTRVIVARLKDDGALAPLATLPSDGDCSYAGMAWHDGLLWVSYYSSHEGKSAIYLAKLAIK